jgi:DNA-binding TFAR19-related protein (PDSD5 family)
MDDIERIRRRKMREIESRLRDRELQKEQKEMERQQVQRVLGQVLKEDALEYLGKLRDSSPDVAAKIEEIVLSLAIQRRVRYKIDKVIIRAIERKVRGIEPTISFVRKGKRTEISERLKEDD